MFPAAGVAAAPASAVVPTKHAFSTPLGPQLNYSLASPPLCPVSMLIGYANVSMKKNPMIPQAHSAVNIEAGERGLEKLKLVLVRVEGIAMLRLLVLLLLLLVPLLLKSI